MSELATLIEPENDLAPISKLMSTNARYLARLRDDGSITLTTATDDLAEDFVSHPDEVLALLDRVAELRAGWAANSSL